MTRYYSLILTVLVILVQSTAGLSQISSKAKIAPKSSLEIVLSEVNLPSHTELIKSHEVLSPYGNHVTFDQYTRGIKVLWAQVKIHHYYNGTYSIQENLNFSPTTPQENFGDVYFPIENKLTPVITDTLGHTTTYVDIEGRIIEDIDHIKYERRDTSLFAKIFAINPINSSGEQYGGLYIDNNDSTNSSLNSEMIWAELNVKYEQGKYFLESEFMEFGEIVGPADEIPYETNDSVYYTRDMPSFEKMNAYYHINETGEYVNKLGYDALTQQLLVDVHAGFADNSGYNPAKHSLQFGKGGVDDAEDGEVVVHEYVHSLSELASPNNTIGAERQAMEEGSCDYFAKAYSLTYNDNTTDMIFSWDGHNEYWDGVKINTSRKYPTDLDNSKDGDRDIWSSALMCVHNFIGRKATDSLLLEHFYYQEANATMTDMANVILHVDSTNFDKRYNSQLKQCFVDAGFILRGASIKAPSDLNPYQILNQTGFATGDGSLKIELQTPAMIQIFNPLGKLIETFNSYENVSLNPSRFTKGVYLILIEIEGNQYVHKILR